MTNLTQRVLTAVVLVVVMILCLFVVRNGAAQILLSAFLLVGVWEWSGFAFRGSIALRLLYVVSAVLVAAAIFANLAMLKGDNLLLWATLAWWLVATAWLFRFDGSAPMIWTLCAGILVLLPAFYAVLILLDMPRGEWLFVWIVSMVAAADIGAFIAGKLAGRRKLAPHISPGKTWEGLYGGLVAAVVAGLVGAMWFGLPVVWFALLAGLIALLSVAGDLTVSAFKRQAGLKDSGIILPGHGGVMDRIDGLVAALPLFLLALRLVGA